MRFSSAWNYQYFSDYLFKDGNVYYRSMASSSLSLEEYAPRLLAADATTFEVFDESLAFDGKTIYLHGKAVATSSSFEQLSPRYFTTDHTMYYFDNSTGALTEVFDELDGYVYMPWEFDDLYRPVADGSYSPLRYRDRSQFYCLSRDGVGSKKISIASPRIIFTEAEEKLVNHGWRSSLTSEVGVIRIFDEDTNQTYDLDCNPV